MKAIALVVVSGGVAYTYAPDHVHVEIVDLDNLGDTGIKTLPAGVGFEELVKEAGIKKHVRYMERKDI